MNINTYGKTPCAVNLVNILEKEEYVPYRRRVTNIFNEYNKLINQVDISNVPEDSKKIIFRMIGVDFDSQLRRLKLPKIVESHLRNVFITNIKRAIKLEKDRNDYVKKFNR